MTDPVHGITSTIVSMEKVARIGVHITSYLEHCLAQEGCDWQREELATALLILVMSQLQPSLAHELRADNPGTKQFISDASSWLSHYPLELRDGSIARVDSRSVN